MAELLLELFSEEIPARLQQKAARDLERAVNDRLIGAGFMPEGVKSFVTPRRLSLVALGLPVKQPDRREEKKGPRVGAPDKAIEGFLKSAGLSSIDECEQREDKKGAYYVAVIDQKGRDTAALIAEFVPEIIRGFQWPKSMRWGAGDLRWVRPLHRILCCFDNEVVKFEVDGIASGDITEGHRFITPDEIQARNYDNYSAKLRAAKVVLDTDERKEIIAHNAQTLCQAQGFELVEDTALLNEVAGLAEWPVVLIGSYDEKFLTLPDEVLTASMRGHQKYFSVKDPKTGRLTNKFICVANIEAPDGGAAMREGYERVLAARLADGWFLYNQDLKTKLEDRLPDLDRVTFFEGLGSVGDKARRVSALAKEIAPAIGADPDTTERAGLLAKADLVTAMVGEFPELQGLIGRYYAKVQGEADDIADAIRDHYKPAGQDEDPPTAPVSVAVALADKLDTLTAFWAIDEKPTGSKDPFALRRAALGVIRLTLENNVRRELPAGVSDLINFFHDRLKVYLRDKGHHHDQIDAVLTDAHGNLQDDLVIIVEKLKALEAFLKTDDGENVAAAYKRAANILKAEEKKDNAPADAANVNEKLLAEDSEKKLFEAITNAETTASAALPKEEFAAAMKALAGLRAPLDAFFDNVTVNADDAALRANRLSLLARVTKATNDVADFSKLEG
ncbi:MAG: glycine--tRNA ligase subunit beta [Marinicaulis sp.]|nr:glycine--tRNA ligase subunit beta [Marinicaulis sp.]